MVLAPTRREEAVKLCASIFILLLRAIRGLLLLPLYFMYYYRLVVWAREKARSHAQLSSLLAQTQPQLWGLSKKRRSRKKSSNFRYKSRVARHNFANFFFFGPVGTFTSHTFPHSRQLPGAQSMSSCARVRVCTHARAHTRTRTYETLILFSSLGELLLSLMRARPIYSLRY